MEGIRQSQHNIPQRTETMTNMNEIVKSKQQKDKSAGKYTDMKQAQEDSLVCRLSSFAIEHHKRILSVSVKVSEFLGFKKTAEFLRVVDYVVCYVQQVVDEVEERYQGDLRNAQGRNGANFNREQFDREYGIQGNRRQHFISAVLLSYNSYEMARTLVPEFLRLFPKQKEDAQVENSNRGSTVSSGSSSTPNPSSSFSKEDRQTGDFVMGEEGSASGNTVTSETGPSGSADIGEENEQVEKDDCTTIVEEFSPTPSALDDNAAIGSDIMFKRYRNFERDGEPSDEELYGIAREMTGLFLFQGNALIRHDGAFSFILIDDPQIEPVTVLIEKHRQDNCITGTIIF